MSSAVINATQDYPFTKRHCLSVSDYHRVDIENLLQLGDHYLDLSVQKAPQREVLAGKTLINLFFENSTRTEKSFELAGKRLGADVISMNVATSSVKKGETLLDTAATLNAMNPDLLVVRHGSSGAPSLLAQKVGCSVINAGDGMHSHPTQALLDALTLRQAFPEGLAGLRIAICGFAKDGAFVMHPGPMNRGVEISSDIADDPDVSLITQQVETGVATRMAILHALSESQSHTAIGEAS